MTKEKEIGSKITIDELAIMMNTSFEDLRSEIRGGLAKVRSEMSDGFERVDEKFVEMNNKFDEVNTRLDTFEEYKDLPEGKRFHNHEHRISKLEDSMRVVKTALGK